jgi:hypothetical protein
MKVVTLSLLVVIAIAAVPAPVQSKIAPKPFRVLEIPAREHGYGNFKTQVITSQEQFDAFLKESAGPLNWNNRAGFLEGIKKAKIDFTREALVLLRDTEGSGSNKVTLLSPIIKGKTLTCQLERIVPPIGTGDIADYCFALVVDRNKISEVRYEVQGQETVTLTIKN